MVRISELFSATFDNINSLSLDELLDYADKQNIKLHSRNIKVIVQSDIAFYLKIDLGFSADKVRKFTSTQDLKIYGWILGGKRIEGYITYKQLLQQESIKIQYINSNNLSEVFYAYYYEKEIPLPSVFNFPQNVLTIPTEIYAVNNENWKAITPYPINKRDYIDIIHVFIPYKSVLHYEVNISQLPAFQSRKKLIKFINETKELKDKFKELTKDVESPKMNFLMNFFRTSDFSYKDMINYFAKVHENDYENRKQLVENYIKDNHKYSIFRSKVNTLENILAYPPYWFEEDVIKGKIKIKSMDDVFRLVGETFEKEMPDIELTHDDIGRLLVYNQSTSIDDAANQIIEFRQLTKNIDREKKKEKQRIEEIIDAIKDVSNLIGLTKEKILQITGFSKSTYYKDETENNFELLQKFKDNFVIERFDFNNNPKICPDRCDIALRNELSEMLFFLIFGSFFKYFCFSTDDLDISFKTNFVEDEGIVLYVFGNPYNINSEFTIEQLKQLSKLMAEQDPEAFGNRELLNEMLQPIKSKINNGLAAGLKIPNIKVIFAKLMEKVASGNLEAIKDREILIKLFIELFYAGMYQRTWKGPGNPYPMTLAETRGSCQEQIDINMTTPINEFLDEFEEEVEGRTREHLSKKMKNVMLNAPLISNAGREEPFTMTIVEFVMTAKKAEWCVGSGSANFIETAYFYLTLLKYKIPDFDMSKFDPESTHR